MLFGVGAFVWPGLTLGVLVILFGAYALADGILLITLSLKIKKMGTALDEATATA